MSTDTEFAVEAAYSQLLAASALHGDRVGAAAQLILAIYNDFYRQLCAYPHLAQRAFETMDPHASIRISQERLGLYSRYIADHGPRILAAFPALAGDSALWDELDRFFTAMIVDRYDADIAFSFAHSIRRNIERGLWRPVAYSFPPPSKLRAYSMASVHRRLRVQPGIDAALLANAMRVPKFSVPFRDLHGDAEKILERVEPVLRMHVAASSVLALDVIEASFSATEAHSWSGAGCFQTTESCRSSWRS
jgi:isocitrate dehydrogenase kinase/phosphatase